MRTQNQSRNNRQNQSRSSRQNQSRSSRQNQSRSSRQNIAPGIAEARIVGCISEVYEGVNYAYVTFCMQHDGDEYYDMVTVSVSYELLGDYQDGDWVEITGNICTSWDSNINKRVYWFAATGVAPAEPINDN